MTNQEKALKLVIKFSEDQEKPDGIPRWEFTNDDIPKQCASICIDEQIKFINDWTPIDWDVRKIMINELKELKKEIKKL